jgi:hypothetical protein
MPGLGMGKIPGGRDAAQSYDVLTPPLVAT